MKNLKFLIIAFFAMFSLSAFADDIDEAEAYKALMKQQLLSQQHAAQQALQANTIESFQAAKIARLKAQLAASQVQQPAPQVVYVQPQPQQQYSMTQQEAQAQVYSSSQYAYHGQTYNVHPLQPMTPLQRSVIPDNPPSAPQLTPDNRLIVPQQEEDENGMTPEERAQEQWESEHMPRQQSQASDGDPLGLQPIRYMQRNGVMIKVGYQQSVNTVRQQVRPQQVIYMQPQPQQRVIVQQPQQVQRVVYLSR